MEFLYRVKSAFCAGLFFTFLLSSSLHAENRPSDRLKTADRSDRTPKNAPALKIQAGKKRAVIPPAPVVKTTNPRIIQAK